jgi:hypothetical protein
MPDTGRPSNLILRIYFRIMEYATRIKLRWAAAFLTVPRLTQASRAVTFGIHSPMGMC